MDYVTKYEKVRLRRDDVQILPHLRRSRWRCSGWGGLIAPTNDRFARWHVSTINLLQSIPPLTPNIVY
jgi:hypothetical protein